MLNQVRVVRGAPRLGLPVGATLDVALVRLVLASVSSSRQKSATDQAEGAESITRPRSSSSARFKLVH